jgi:hypothetical protein
MKALRSLKLYFLKKLKDAYRAAVEEQEESPAHSLPPTLD